MKTEFGFHMKKAAPAKHPLPRAGLVWTAHAFTRATDNASVCTCKLKGADDASVLKGVAVAHILNLDVNETTMEGHLLMLLIPNPAVELTSIVVSVSSVLLGKAEPNLS